MGIGFIRIGFGLGPGEGDDWVHLELCLEHLDQFIFLGLPILFSLGVV
jgi:hypothetical protein